MLWLYCKAVQWYSMRLVCIAGYCLNVSFKSTNIMSGIQVYNLQEVFPRLDPEVVFHVESSRSIDVSEMMMPSGISSNSSNLPPSQDWPLIWRAQLWIQLPMAVNIGLWFDVLSFEFNSRWQSTSVDYGLQVQKADCYTVHNIHIRDQVSKNSDCITCTWASWKRTRRRKLSSTIFTTLECPMCQTWFSFNAKQEGRRHSAWAGVILRERRQLGRWRRYNPDKWPVGALIRPYKLRTQTTRIQQTTRDQRPPRPRTPWWPRTHQEPHARSYRRQSAARSSNWPTEYTRARDSYDSGKTYCSDDTDNTRVLETISWCTPFSGTFMLSWRVLHRIVCMACVWAFTFAKVIF